jgi:hypothetical protein
VTGEKTAKIRGLLAITKKNIEIPRAYFYPLDYSKLFRKQEKNLFFHSVFGM